jgi:CRP/FNR family cyclic AMP-dependent transcriptional regulator
MAENKSYRKGALIIREGSYQRDAYIIEKGKVEVSRQDEKGNKTVIAIRGEKEIIGEMALLEGNARCATVTALEECEVRILEYEAFKDLPDSNSGVKALRKIMDARKKAETSPT